MVSVSVTLSEWIFRAVKARSVLTLSRDYFVLRKPLERRLYALARKHCGQQANWRVSVEVLLKKSGSHSPRRVFRAMLRDIIARDSLPDYALAEEPGDMIAVSRRDTVIEAGGRLLLSPEALEEARRLAPGADVYALEAEWQSFASRTPPRAPDAAFLGWLRKRLTD